MPVDKIVIKDNSAEKEVIDFTNRAYSGLANGYHDIEIEAHYQNSVVSSVKRAILVSSGAYEPEYQAVLDFAVANSIPTPTLEQQRLDNAFLVSYKSSGAWDKRDVFLKFSGTASPTFKLICWKRVIQVTEAGVLSWGNSGAKGNGFNAYIDTLFVPANGTTFTQDNASILFDIREFSNTGIIFGNDNIRLNKDIFRLNDVSEFTNSTLVIGLNEIVRDLASSKKVINETTQSSSATSTALSNNSITIFGTNAGTSVENLSDAHIGLFTIGSPHTPEERDMITKLIDVIN